MKASDLKRMCDLDDENRQLKRMFTDLSLENRALKDVIEKKPRGAGVLRRIYQRLFTYPERHVKYK